MRARIALAALCAALLAASWACSARELQGEALDNSQLLGGGADGGGRSLAQAAPAPPGPAPNGSLADDLGGTFGDSGLWASFVLLMLWAVPVSLIFCCVICR